MRMVPWVMVAVAALATPVAAKPQAWTAAGINGVAFAPLPEPPAKRPSAAIIKAEVLLDRARFSPGAIDGIDGDNLRRAVAAYQAARALPTSGRLDQATWDSLTRADGAPAMVTRTITADDLKRHFATRIPAKFEAQAGLKRLAYTSPVEELSEQVHASPGLLRALNPGAHWKRVGQSVLQPQVVAERPKSDVARIAVDKPGHAVLAYGADDRLVAFYPASIGSTEKPAPSGDFVIERVTHNPDYTYNPKYAFKGVTAKKPFTIAPGPNNPVGSVWMALSDEGYGIHGTPQPDLVGKTQSHGCIRLTNWDAEDLASMVGRNTPVSFRDQPVVIAGPPAVPAAATAASPGGSAPQPSGPGAVSPATAPPVPKT